MSSTAAPEKTIFRCPHLNCTKSYNRKDRYNAHLRAHEINPDGTYSCPIESCQRKLSSHDHVMRHLRMFHESKTDRYNCPLCYETFVLKKELRHHTVTVHNYHDLQCTFESCGKIFVTPNKLKEHMKSHEPGQKPNDNGLDISAYENPVKKRERPSGVVYKCMEPNCERTYAEKKNLMAHRRSVHGESVKYHCPHPGCDSSFGYNSTLRRHLMNIHGVTPAHMNADGMTSIASEELSRDYHEDEEGEGSESSDQVKKQPRLWGDTNIMLSELCGMEPIGV